MHISQRDVQDLERKDGRMIHTDHDIHLCLLQHSLKECTSLAVVDSQVFTKDLV